MMMFSLSAVEKLLSQPFFSVVVHLTHVFQHMGHLPLTLMTSYSLLFKHMPQDFDEFVAPGIVTALYATLPINHFYIGKPLLESSHVLYKFGQ